jgi:hypothetical protein
MIPKLFAALAVSLLLARAIPAAEDTAPNKARVLAIVPSGAEPLAVSMITDGERSRSYVGGLVMALVNNATAKNRNDPLAAQLTETLAGYERAPVFANAVTESFKRHAAVFDVATSMDRARYVAGRDDLTAAAAEENFDYVLLLDSEFVGLWMVGAYTKTDDLAPAQTIRYRLIPTKEPRVLAKGVATGHGLQRRPYKEAAVDREFFVTTWPAVCAALANQIVGDLNRKDMLHAMAKSVGRGDEMPAVGALLKKYENTFRWKLEPVAGWRETKLDTNYARVLEPKDASNLSFGLRFEVDLLVSEFGQDVATVDEYIVPTAVRRLEILPKSTPIERWDGIDAPGFDVFRSETGDGGQHVLMFRKLGERHMQVINAVFVRDFDTLFPKNREKIEKMIAQSRIELR